MASSSPTDYDVNVAGGIVSDASKFVPKFVELILQHAERLLYMRNQLLRRAAVPRVEAAVSVARGLSSCRGSCPCHR